MRALALVCSAEKRFALSEVVVPDPEPDQVAIRACWSGVSIGTEFALIRGKISWGPYPLCTGYQGVGVVTDVGEQVQGLRPGDLVYYRGNAAMRLADGGPVSCVSGTHCSHVVIRPDTTHGAYPLPAGVPLDAASLFVMPAVGLHGVDMANPRAGEVVVVYGVGLIGLGVAAACVHRGCVVIAVDRARDRLNLAASFGVDHLIQAGTEEVGQSLRGLAPSGADVVFESTGEPAALDEAIALCRTGGRFVWQGNYGAAPVSFHFLPAHARQIAMLFPCDDGLQPCRRAVLRNMATGALPWSRTITHRLQPREAPEMFERILEGRAEGVIGMVIHWSDP